MNRKGCLPIFAVLAGLILAWVFYIRDRRLPEQLAAQHEPVQLGREAVDAGTAAARQAAGVLFSELGQLLQKAGEKLRH